MAGKVSVVLPTYDRPDLVGRAIDSVLSQTYQNLECIVVDDHSPESETTDLVTALANEKIKYIRHQENRGLSAARNTGIEEAEGEFLAFLDDDDEWLPEKLEKQMTLIDGLPREYGLVYCWMDYINTQGKVERAYRPKYRGDILPHVLDGQRIGAGSTLLLRAEVANDVGGFDENLPRGIDGDFIRRVCREYKVDFVPETLVRYNVGHGHKRITRSDPEGIRNALKGEHTKLQKFPDLLDRYPRRKANIYARIAYHHGQLHEWDRCMGYFLRSFRTSTISIPVYLKLLESVALGTNSIFQRVGRLVRGD